MAWHTGLSIEVSEAKALEPGLGLLLPFSCLNTYCGVTIDNTKICRTATKFNTATPLWTEEFYFHCPQKGFHHVAFTVTHDDSIVSRKLGRLMLSWEQIRNGPINGWYPLTEVLRSDEVQGELYVAVARFPERGGGRLRVLVSEAKDLAAKDAGGSSDPYCTVSFNGASYKTKKLDRTRFPVWTEAFDFPLAPDGLANSSLILTVLDKDLLDDDFMGEVIIPFYDISSIETAMGRWYTLLPRTKDRSEQEPQGSLRIKVSLTREHVMSPEVYAPLREVMTSAVTDTYGAQLFNMISRNSALPLASTAKNLMAFYLSDELALEYLQCVCNAELLELKDPNTLFRANSLASKSLDNLLKLTSIPYLKSTLQAIVIQIIQEDRNCEIDPTKLLANAESKRRSLAGFFESPATSAVEQVGTYLRLCMDTILRSEHKCPLLVRRALKQLFLLSAQHFPEHTQLPYLAVSGFLFLRFFAAAILTPKLFSLCETYPNERASRSLTLLAKLVQSVANMSTANESYMRPFDLLVQEQHSQLREFINRLVDVPFVGSPGRRTKLSKQMSFEGCVLIAGFLQKCKLSNIRYFLGSMQTGVNFKRRYFELTTHSLTYYADSSTRVVKGCIPVCSIEHVEQMDPEALGFKYTLQLRIQSPGERDPMYFFMIATSLNEMRAWLSTLSKCCLYNNKQSSLYHPGFFKRSSWSCCRSKEKNFPGCKATRQSVILGDWQDPLELNFELQTIFSQLYPIRTRIPKLICPDSNIPEPRPADTEPPDVPFAPQPRSPIGESCMNLLAAIDSITAAREDQRKF